MPKKRRRSSVGITPEACDAVEEAAKLVGISATQMVATLCFYALGYELTPYQEWIIKSVRESQ